MVPTFATMNALFISAIALGTSANAILLQNTAPFFVYVVSVYVLGEPAEPVWNFHKILIGKDGQAIRAFGPRTEPDDADMAAEIKKAL